MKILLTGSCGYIGSILTKKLLAEGHEVVGVDAMWFGNHLEKSDKLTLVEMDIRQADKLPWDGVEAVIHLANIANDPCGDLSPKLSWEVNVLATMGLAENAISHGVSQFIFFSSGSVYGVKEEPEVTEELPLVPISDYNKTKMISERVLLSYRDKILVQCLRPATVCGLSPRMRLDLTVNMLTMQALKRGQITVLGGAQERPNVHVQDITDAAIHLLNKKCPGIYNAGFENLSVMEIARTIAGQIPAEIQVKESNDPRSYRLSSKKLLDTGFKPRYGIKDAISELVKAYGDGLLTESDANFNIKTMKSVLGME